MNNTLRFIAAACVAPFAFIGVMLFIGLLYVTKTPWIDYPDARHAPR